MTTPEDVRGSPELLVSSRRLFDSFVFLSYQSFLQFISIIISILRFLIYPIVFSSLMASGMSNATNLIFSEIEIEANVTSLEQHFVLGMVTGFTLEIATGISILVECFKFALLLRLWKNAKSEEMENHQEKIPKSSLP